MMYFLYLVHLFIVILPHCWHLFSLHIFLLFLLWFPFRRYTNIIILTYTYIPHTAHNVFVVDGFRFSVNVMCLQSNLCYGFIFKWKRIIFFDIFTMKLNFKRMKYHHTWRSLERLIFRRRKCGIFSSVRKKSQNYTLRQNRNNFYFIFCEETRHQHFKSLN